MSLIWNPQIFYGVLALSGILSIVKFKEHLNKSWAIWFFIAIYTPSEVFFQVFGNPEPSTKFLILAIASLVMLGLYDILEPDTPIKFAASIEFTLILVNIAVYILTINAITHFKTTVILNYVSFLVLTWSRFDGCWADYRELIRIDKAISYGRYCYQRLPLARKDF